MFVTDSPFYTWEIVFHGISNVSVTLDMSETAQPGQFLGLLAGGAAFSFAEGAYFSVSVDAPSITSETLRDFGEGYDYSTEGYWWSIFGFDYDALATDTTLSARNTINFRYGADRAPGKDLIEYSFIGPYDYSHREEIFSEAQLGQGFDAADWKGRFSNKLSEFDQIVLRTSEGVDPFDAFFFGDDPQIPDQELGVDFTVDAASRSGTAGFAYAPDGDWTLSYDRAFASGPDSMILWFE
jgi:hypothetical protein